MRPKVMCWTGWISMYIHKNTHVHKCTRTHVVQKWIMAGNSFHPSIKFKLEGNLTYRSSSFVTCVITGVRPNMHWDLLLLCTRRKLSQCDNWQSIYQIFNKASNKVRTMAASDLNAEWSRRKMDAYLDCLDLLPTDLIHLSINHFLLL